MNREDFDNLSDIRYEEKRDDALSDSICRVQGSPVIEITLAPGNRLRVKTLNGIHYVGKSPVRQWINLGFRDITVEAFEYATQ